MESVYYIFAVIIVVALIICLFLKLIRSAAILACILCTVSIVFSIFWGNGQGYVDFAASYLPDDKKYALQDWYSNFKKAEAEDPVINSDKIISDVESLTQGTIDGITQVFTDTSNFS